MSITTRLSSAWRALTGVSVRNYDGAQVTRLTSDWFASSGSADTLTRAALPTLRQRSRDAERNTAYIARYLDILENNVVGARGVGVQSKVALGNVPDDKTNRAIETRWKEWTQTVKFNEAVRKALRSAARDGDSIWLHDSKAGVYAFRQMEGDLLDDKFNEAYAETKNEVRMGVELDGAGDVIAFHVLGRHPGEWTNYAYNPMTRQRIPADKAILVARTTRIGQTRGIPWTAPVLMACRQLSAYEEAEIVAKRIASSKMGFYKTTVPDSFGGEEDAQRNLISEVQPGIMEELPPGCDVVPFDLKHDGASYAQFTKDYRRKIAAGLNVNYNLLASDLEGVNYSSIRAGVQEDREHFMAVQEWLIATLIRPVFEKWLEIELAAGRIPGKGIKDFAAVNRPEFKPRRWGYVNPMQDVQAKVVAIKNRLSSHRQEISEMGGDVEDVFTDAASDQALAEAKGIALDAEAAPVIPDDPADS
jgi:lambda family phage portal protein